jgi:hypothetical protein
MPTEPQHRSLRELTDIAVNWVTLLVGVVTIGYLIYTYQAQAKRQPTVVQGMRKGMAAPQVPGVNYSTPEQTLVLVLGSSCPYCRRDVPFYKQAISAAEQSGKTNVVAVFASKDVGAHGFLEDNGIKTTWTKVDNFNVIKIRGTPTVFLVDHLGRVSDFWVGAMMESTMQSILKQL